MLCKIRDTEKRRICPDLDSLSVWHELQNTKPSVTSVAFPATSKSLGVEHHLINVNAGLVLIDSPADSLVITIDDLAIHLLTGMSMMTADHKSDIRNLAEKLSPKLLA